MTTTLAVPAVRRLRYEPTPGAQAPARLLSRVIAQTTPFVLPELDEAPVRRVLGTTLQLAVEVLDGRRPPEQLEALLEPGVMAYWRAEVARRPAGGASRLVRMRVVLPHPDAAEVAAVCRVDGRVRALAARFERRGLAWSCVVLRLV